MMNSAGFHFGFSRLLLIVFLFWGCGGTGGDLLPKKEGPLVAIVNSSSITKAEYEERGRQVARLKKFDLETMKGKKDLLDELIDDELLFLRALKEKLYADPAVKRKLINMARNRYLKTEYKPTDKEMQEYFDAHRTEMETIRARHILIKPEKPNDRASEEEARKRAEELLARIKAGADFMELAKKHSDDNATANRGGDLRFFDRQRMVGSFTDAAFALTKAGDLSEVVKTEFGYHIIQLIDSRKSLDHYKGRIRSKLLAKKRQDARAELIQDLRRNSKIRVNDDVLTAIDFSHDKKGLQLDSNAENKKLEEAMKQMPPDVREKFERLQRQKVEEDE